MKFEELSKNKTSEVEKEILEKWKQINILEKSIENRRSCEDFVFYDGPATANGMPGLHHMLAKFLKDTFCKYKTMQGYKVLRKVGWDTHGLPVELEVEKQLGFKQKTDIEKYGISEFNQKCKESVWKNEKSFSDLTEKMGQFIDLKDPYVTYDNNYIETGWWILKKFFEEGYFYEGYKILPYCPRCGTGLASHEVAQGYKEVTVDTVVVPMKKKDEDVYFLVWTTTPWTLVSNVAICVNPDEEYVKVDSKGYKFILASSLATVVLGEEYEVLETYKGKDLEYIEYEQLIPELKVDKKAFFVTCDNYVTMEDGTGIVHMAPAFGQDDYNVGKRYDLPVLNPVGEDGKYLEGPWKDMLVFDADLEIIKYLKANDKLFKKQKVVHNYPHCWRCESPLVYYSKPSYYLEITKLKDKIVEENNKVNWYPSYVGEKRFGNWLENLNDWAISRNRYWGTPIPLWRCDCGHMHMVGSRKELVELAIEDITEEIDLHRPYVDDVHIKCDKCGKTMSRIIEVMDCWFDSGSMPFAQYHYPFENKELWESQFPASFICEGIDQTRGWFYTLMVLSVFVTGKAPYKNVLVNDLLLDKHGKKMSKSKGNAVNPFDLIDEYGADTIRWYLPSVSPVWLPLKFDEEGLKDVYSKFISTLKNTYNFFAIYANTDDIDPRTFTVDYEKRPEIDKWLLSKYNKLVKNVTEYMESYDLTNTVRSIQEFVGEDLSNWYIRRNRRRFWSSELDDDKKAVYNTTHEILVGICKLIAPIVPYVSEEIYTKLTNEESVHLADYPVSNEKYINDSIENRMDLVRELISLGRNIREEVKIKVRQPMSEALIDGKNQKMIEDLVPLIEEELNVKKVSFITDLENYMNFIVKPNFKEVGKVFGPKIKAFGEQLLELSSEQVNDLQNGNTINMTIEGEIFEVTESMVDIRTSSKEGFDVATLNSNFIILNTELTEDLVLEGIAREMISKVQNLRKTSGLEITDRITICYESDSEVENAIDSYKEFIMNETLSLDIKVENNSEEEIDLNGHTIKIKIEKAN
jgi:isoleucyl-tRNA synthetase